MQGGNMKLQYEYEKAYFKGGDNSKATLGNIADFPIIGMEIGGELFELQYDIKAKRLILWTDGDLIIKCKSGNTVILKDINEKETCPPLCHPLSRIL